MRIFVSHAVKDGPVVKAFIELLSNGFGINPADVFCSSSPGLDITAGHNFVQYIREKLQSADFVFLLVSPNYFSSNFCLAELGGTWAKELPYMPLLFPEVSYSDLDGILVGVHVYRINERSALLKSREDFGKTFPKHPLPSVAHYDIVLKEFVKKTAVMFPELPPPSKVPFEDFKNECDKNAVFTQEISDLKAIVRDKEGYIAQLELLKDRDAVRQLKLDNSDDNEKFEAVSLTVRKAFSKLPNIVVKALFYEHGPGDFWPNPEEMTEAQDAVEEGYFRVGPSGSEYYPNRDDRRVIAARHALEELSSFIMEAGDAWHDEFENENDFKADLSNRRFFESL